MDRIHKSIFIVIVYLPKRIARFLKEAGVIGDNVAACLLLQKPQVFFTYFVNSVRARLSLENDLF
ncbi:hypothetical protein D3C84_888610 [compost metagenome]